MVMFQSVLPPLLVLMIHAPAGCGYRECLAASGFRVAAAKTTRQKFERAIALLPDLMVLALRLTGGLVRRLRRETATSANPIIALTDITSPRAGGAGEVPASLSGAGS